MNFYELGKEVQVLLSAASSIDKRFSEAAARQSTCLPAPVGGTSLGGFLTDFPCVPDRVVASDFEFSAALHAFTIISNTARGNDYVVATVSNQPLFDEKNNPLGNNLFLVQSALQSMVALADNLDSNLGDAQAAVDLCYGVFNYQAQPNPPGDIPIVFGVRASWTPTSGDFGAAGDGLLISLEAKLVENQGSCDLRIRARSQTAFNGTVTEFRAGSVATQQKLDALASAYYRARVEKKGFEALGLVNGVLSRMQMQQ